MEELPRQPIDISYVKEIVHEEASACQWSTLDLCSPFAWTLIVGEDDEERISSLQQHFEAAGLSLNVWRLHKDFQVIRPEIFAQEIEQQGLLVRPDQHIMALLKRETTAEEVAGALNISLGK